MISVRIGSVGGAAGCREPSSMECHAMRHFPSSPRAFYLKFVRSRLSFPSWRQRWHSLLAACRRLWHRQPEKWSTAELGWRGEKVAARYLRRKGYRIVARRYRCRRGELDLVAVSREGTIVFVEVKSGRGGRHRQPGRNVTTRKQQRVLHAARMFLAEHHLRRYPHRFDVVAVVWDGHTRRPTVSHERCAFVPGSAEQWGGRR